VNGFVQKKEILKARFGVYNANESVANEALKNATKLK
jgi:hypothetical protein